ncbi:MAG: serine hydrolase domain-containing protein [Vicinamibacteria bacterium]
MELKRVGSPEQAGFSEARLRNALEVLLDAVEKRVFPGGVVVVGRRGELVMEQGFGALDAGDAAPRVSVDTIYDVASLTKVVVTTTLAMILYDSGRLALDAKVRDFFPEFSGGGKEAVAVADLLSHSSGILWWKDLYRSVKAEWSMAEVEEWYLEQICLLPLDYRPRTKSVYSDLGIIVLGGILERASGRRLDETARDSIFVPLRMSDTCFKPPTSLKQRIAPTGRSSWRDRMLVGEVHDDNAAAMGGVAPHAGLFSTGHDLAVFAQMMLNEGTLDDRRVVKRSTVELFTRRVEGIPESSRALGWDTPSRESTAGRYFSLSSFGHLGFTGTSLWIDPVRELFVVLLTNRMSPSRDQGTINGVRASFHDAVMEALAEVPPLRTA